MEKGSIYYDSWEMSQILQIYLSENICEILKMLEGIFKSKKKVRFAMLKNCTRRAGKATVYLHPESKDWHSPILRLDKTRSILGELVI